MAKIIVVHGYTASPEENWFPWLQNQANAADLNLKVLRLDPSKRPSLATWQSQMQQQIGQVQADDIFIAHSLGCIATLHYLTQALQQTTLAKLILVAGFNGRLDRLEEVNPFIDAADVDFKLLKQQIAQRIVIYSEGDDRVLPKFSLEQAKSLDADIIVAQHQGHFIDSEGCTALPEVWQAIMNQN